MWEKHLSLSVAHQASCTLGLGRAVVVLGVLLVQTTVRPVTGPLRSSRPPRPSHSVGSTSSWVSSSSLVVISSYISVVHRLNRLPL
jgi:hypothetical protein